MRKRGQLAAVGAGLLWMVLLASCAGLKPDRAELQILSLDQAVARIGQDLFGGVPDEGAKRSAAAVDLFVNAESGEVPMGARQIQVLLLQQSHRQDRMIEAVSLDGKNQTTVRYLITGTIASESWEGHGEAVYRLRGVLTDLKTDRIIQSAEARFADADFDISPTALYRDNPFFDPVYQKKKVPGEAPRDTAAAPPAEYSVQTLVLLREASDAYERGAYQKSLSLFEEAADRRDGQTLWTYSGMYLACEKLGKVESADEAFERILSISVARYRMVTVRFLFQVDSMEFWDPARNEGRYLSWLQRIGKYFDRTEQCLQVVGHCSKTGPETYNESLSFKRAKKIQQLLGEFYPRLMTRTEAVGKGSTENVVGIGSDDARDALDRRVELLIVECGG